MELQQVKKMSEEELRRKIDECFTSAGLQETPPSAEKLLAQAEFYMRELEHRSDSKTSFRDLVLEVFVIALIGWEILMGYRQDAQQAQAFQQEQVIWKNMEASSDATAKQSQATAKLLESLDHSMESTKNAVQGQLAVSYDPSVLVHFVVTQRLQVLNNGHTNITLWGSKLGGDVPFFLTTPSMLPPNGGYEFNAEPMYKQMSEKLGKGPSLSLPYDIYIKNELGRKFVVECTLTATLEHLQVIIVTQVNAISAREWQKHK